MPDLTQKILQLTFILILLNFSDVCSQQSDEPETGVLAGQATNPSVSSEPGLLFYLSGENEFIADFAAGGQAIPNYLRDVRSIPGGAIGKGFEADDSQLISYWAPGNIYAQRGTLSFFWRSRYPVGSTEFPIFRVGYADHSSWDMAWLRIDYNGSGFDAFVTDIGLTRTRVSHFMDHFPQPDEWTHIALSWDETEGIRFYINGELVEKKSITGKIYDTGLDQFGFHSRIISPYQVQSAYCFQRGGDMDELRIYDRMLSDENIAGLATGIALINVPPLNRQLNERRWRDAWWTRHGWNLPNNPPPVLSSSTTSVRKVEIHDAIDIKRWYWKANDGIRETTWPGVYNMSRLPGRYDYFVLPDWDCYSMSGQTVKFHIPSDESWNHVEMWGKAWGQLTFESEFPYQHTFSTRSPHQVKSYHRLENPKKGGVIRFDNALIEEPIGSFDVFYVSDGGPPEGMFSENFILVSAPALPGGKGLSELAAFIYGRYPVDERAMMTAIPLAEREKPDRRAQKYPTGNQMHPFIHIMIPYNNKVDAGLDGIEIELPPLDVKPTHDELFPVNIRIKDPLWPMRDLTDFSFSVKPGQPYKIWFDTRDRILPEGKAFYITIAGSGADLTPEKLQGTRLRMVYKPKKEAVSEHETDRFTQIRDLYAHIVEERPRSPKLNLFNRIMADCRDLLRVSPDHWLARTYKYAITGEDQPEYEIRKNPGGIPEWAHLQIEYLRHLERIVMYYINERQISNGEFGGGLSDDGDLSNMWPGTAFLGIEPEKIKASLSSLMSAYYDYDRDPYHAPLKQRSLPLFTNGLATIRTDELHAYEEGISVVGQMQLIDYGNPLYINRGMETALRLLNDITRINPAGHRHIRSRYYGGTKIATEDPWQWSVHYSYLVLHAAYMTVLYNGNPVLRKMITELADGLLAHKRDGIQYTEIHFNTDEDRGSGDPGRVSSLFSAAYLFTGETKYLEPTRGITTETGEFDKNKIAERYANEIKALGVLEYINTKGNVWIDRVSARMFSSIQEDRLGGVALIRGNYLVPEHRVSWKFLPPANWESTAIFIPVASASRIDIIGYNLEKEQTGAEVTLWNITPGMWRIRKGVDSDDDMKADTDVSEYTVYLENGETIRLDFKSRMHSIINLELIKPAETGYWERPDLAIHNGDIKTEGRKVSVRVYNLGAKKSPAATVALKDSGGKTINLASIPPVEAPVDLIPKYVDLEIPIPGGIPTDKGTIEIDPEKKIIQITRLNDTAEWKLK